MSGLSCHAVRVRLAAPADPSSVAAQLSAVGDVPLWVQECPFPAAHPASVRLRERELARPVAGARAVLLRYSDGVGDLLVLADRERLGVSALRDLAAVVRGVAPAAADEPAAGGTHVGPTSVSAGPPPSWGMGDGDGTGDGTVCRTVPADEAGTPASWLAALAVTLDGYRGHDATGQVLIGVGATALQVRLEGTLGDLRSRPASGPVAATLDTAALVAAVGDEYRPGRLAGVAVAVTVQSTPDGGVEVRCDHSLRDVSPPQAAQFVDSLRHVHRQVLTRPELPATEVDLLDPDASTRVVALGRPTPALVTTPRPVHEAFGLVAAAHPEAVALTDDGDSLTYRQLDERSTSMAYGLRLAGVRRGDRVGVCLERGAELVCTLLAVLKAGATYVPADPAYPSERLAHTARDAGVRLVVTRLDGFPAVVPVVRPADLVATPDDEPLPSVGPDDPAYVIYTSGSTGRPKGVVVPHRNVVALVDATRDEYGLGPTDVWTLFHSSAFDFSVWEMWGCLLTGGRLVVVPFFVSREPERFRDLLVAERVSVLSQTPSAFAQLLDVPHDEVVARLVVFGGEPLDTRMLLRWLDRHPESACRLVNMFGITETTVHVTAQTLDRGHALSASRSVGPALPGWHLYVLDAAGRPAPVGVPGEICVGGVGVAAGYLDQPELTDERFVPDPYAEGRMYRSGDLGRLRPDGALEHLGRIDSQVKVRGFRIELDEIRSVLLEDARVRAAAVVVSRDDAADAATARLHAYVVTEADPAEVRRRAATVLPDYMLPATVTVVPALPLTPNGKLDADRLPPPAQPAPVAAAVPAPPTQSAAGPDDLATVLRTVWSEVLGVAVGDDDDFFELGGNSLLAVRISAAMRTRGMTPVPLRQLYRHPSIRRLVGHLDAQPAGR
ncbi:non-ribosomal peptide synthetase [Micromonospora sp. NPDC005298]|uniref:non-ribosomal peptide synthetase n=1 Tax=Micromonospora sp. NPDC005298 TaxID=3156873 RepID=UPI0033A17BC2